MTSDDAFSAKRLLQNARTVFFFCADAKRLASFRRERLFPVAPRSCR